MADDQVADQLVIPHSGIVSVAELCRYMANPQWNQSQKVNVANTLAGVQAELEQYLNRPVEPVQIRETVVADSTGHLNLRVSPVLEVLSVSALGASENVVATYQGALPDVQTRSKLVERNGRVIDAYRGGAYTPFIVPGGVYIQQPGMAFVIEYVAGHNGYTDEGLKNAIKRVAAREVAGNHDQTVSFRGTTATEAKSPDDRPRGWTEDELVRWDRMRRRVIV